MNILITNTHHVISNISKNVSTVVTPTPPSEIILFQWTWYQTLLTIILITIVLTTICGNLFVLCDFVTRARTKFSCLTPTNYFIANLSLADFLVGVLVLPFLATKHVTGRWYFGQHFCTSWVCIHFWLCASSILSTCSVCIERYIGVRYPIQHMRLLNRKRIYLMIICVWILAAVPTTLRVFLWSQPYMEEEYKCIMNERLGHAIIACIFVLYIPSGIMTILYWRIYQIASQHLNVMSEGLNGASGLRFNRSQRTYSESRITSENIASTDCKEGNRDPTMYLNSETSRLISSPEDKQIRLAKRLCFLVGVIILSYFPYFTLILVKAIDPRLVNPNLFKVFEWFRYFNSCINPFIYAYAVPAYRKAFIKSANRVRKSFSRSTIN